MTSETVTARSIPACSFEQGYTDFDGSSAWAGCNAEATWLAWFPPTGEQYESPAGTVLPYCGFHETTVEAEAPEAEVVQIATLPMTCSACHEPVWPKHAEGHATVQADACEWCHGLAESRAAQGIDIPTATEHAACSCPEYAAYLKAMGEPC